MRYVNTKDNYVRTYVKPKQQNSFFFLGSDQFKSICGDQITLFKTADKIFDKTTLKGAVRYGTFKFMDFTENWYIEVPVIPHRLLLQSKSCFCYLVRKFAFLWENYN